MFHIKTSKCSDIIHYLHYTKESLKIIAFVSTYGELFTKECFFKITG